MTSLPFYDCYRCSCSDRGREPWKSEEPAYCGTCGGSMGPIEWLLPEIPAPRPESPRARLERAIAVRQNMLDEFVKMDDEVRILMCELTKENSLSKRTRTPPIH